MAIILELNGWLDGITASIIVFTSIIFGIFYIYKGQKLGAKLLTIGGFMAAFTGLLWLGPCFDFLWILISPAHQNIDNSILNGLYGILSYMWVLPASTFALYLGSKLLFPTKKPVYLTLTVIYIGIGILFEIILFMTTADVFDFTIPSPLGSAIIEANFKRGIAYLLIALNLIGVAIINGGGSIIAAIKGTGIVRRKFIYLAVTWFLFVGVAIFDAYLHPDIFLFIVRMGMVIEVLLLYLALKP